MKDRIFWYWVWLRTIMCSEKVTNVQSGYGQVWDNLHIITAKSEVEAYSKAVIIGHSLQGNSRGTLRYNGAPAYTTFLGITDMGLIHEDLEDGAEILFRSRTMLLRKAQSEVKTKEELSLLLEAELAPIRAAASLSKREALPAPVQQGTPYKPPEWVLKNQKS